ncbi:MAG: hypothetical protein ACOYVD_15900, partial [Bacillota bacterium]
MKDILQKQILQIKSIYPVSAVILVGSVVDVWQGEKDNTKLNDIDLFILTNRIGVFEREIKEEQGFKWDISYIPINVLTKGLEEKWSFLVCSLVKGQVIECCNANILELLEKAKLIFEQGPKELSPVEIRYIRFNLYDRLQDIQNRKNDEVAAKFLVYALLKDVLIEYFRLNNRWLPKDKKFLGMLKEEDKDLYRKCIQL